MLPIVFMASTSVVIVVWSNSFCATTIRSESGVTSRWTHEPLWREFDKRWLPGYFGFSSRFGEGDCSA